MGKKLSEREIGFTQGQGYIFCGCSVALREDTETLIWDT